MSFHFTISVYFISYLLSFHFVHIVDAHVDTKPTPPLDHNRGPNWTSLNISEGRIQSERIQTQDLTNVELSEDEGKSEHMSSPQDGRQVNSTSSRPGEGYYSEPEPSNNIQKPLPQARQTTSETTTLPQDTDDEVDDDDDDDEISTTTQIDDGNSSRQQETVKTVEDSTQNTTGNILLHSDEDGNVDGKQPIVRSDQRSSAVSDDDDDDDDDDHEALPYPMLVRSTDRPRSVTDDSSAHGSRVNSSRATTVTNVDTRPLLMIHHDKDSLLARVIERLSHRDTTTAKASEGAGPGTSSSVRATTPKASAVSTTKHRAQVSTVRQVKKKTSSPKPTQAHKSTPKLTTQAHKSKPKSSPPLGRQALKVIDGDSARPKQFKYMVYLKFRYKYKDASGQSQSVEKEASGAIISHLWVITSLHIVPNVFVYIALNPDKNDAYQTESLEVDVEAGTVLSGAATTDAGVQHTMSRHPGAVWCHPHGKRYRDGADVDGEVWYMQDVALVHLNGEPLSFGDHVGSVSLIEGDFPGNYLHCELVGFAQAEGATAWRLYYAKVSAGDWSYCETLRGYSYPVWPKSYHVCAHGEEHKRGCFGDSGSALVCNVYDTLTYVGVLNGIWTNVDEDDVNCSDAKEPFTHYVYTGSIHKWLKEVTTPYFISSTGRIRHAIPLTFSTWLYLFLS